MKGKRPQGPPRAPWRGQAPQERTPFRKPLAEMLGVTQQFLRNNTINWTHTEEEAQLGRKIVQRAITEARALGMAEISDHSAWELFMDIINVHLNGCPLNLHRLAETADSTAFWADLRGIKENVNREAGGLLNGFKPQFAWPQN